MYLPKHFEVSDNDEIFAFMEQYSFGQLISNANGRLFSTHIPFLISREENQLIGHLAKANPQHKTLEGQEILVTMQGAHDYVSPSWFETPGVPTWNYQAVHVYGHCEVIEEPERIAGIVDALTHKHESAFEEPWQPEYREAMLNAIVGIEVTISEIQAKYKLSQNRSEQDQNQIADGLETKGSMGLAGEMRRA